MEERKLKNQIESELKFLIYLIGMCEKAQLTDRDWYLDFEDELNKLSTKDHSL